jgi:hypothetical protein
MLIAAFALMLQAATPQPTALVTEATAPPETVAAADTQAPQRKRVCRTRLDNRTGIIAKQRKVCRFVDGSDTGAN